MFEPLETSRLLLKNIGPEDAAFMRKEFSTDEVNEFLFDAEPIASIGEAMEWIALFSQREPRNQHRWILLLKESGEKIGTCGFHCWDRDAATAEIGYDLQPAFWRNGYMREELLAAVSFAREKMKLRALYAHISEQNAASMGLAEKIGFRRTGETYDEVFRERKYPHFIYRLDL